MIVKEPYSVSLDENEDIVVVRAARITVLKMFKRYGAALGVGQADLLMEKWKETK